METMKRGQQALRCRKPPRLQQQIAELITPDRRKPHEHVWIVQVMVRDIEFLGIRIHQVHAFFKVNPDNERLAILMKPGKHLSIDLARRPAV
jgi:hypothetical protein